MKQFFLTVLLFTSIVAFSQNQFRSGVFLTHSTGQNIWGPNGSSTSIPQEIQAYNTQHGYTGNQAVTMQRQSFPLTPWDNEWERWHRIFDGQDPQANITPILNSNKIVVIKSCFPSSAMTGWGVPSDTLTYSKKTVYNYKWHWRNIILKMAEHPENFFAIWTNAPLNQANTNANAAMLSKKFCTWAKDTLAMGLDPEMGAMPPNVYIFNYFAKLTDANGYQKPQYAVSNGDSHPNAAATALVAPQFVSEIFGAAIAYEQGAVLTVTPSSRLVGSGQGSVSFTVTATQSWSAQSNASWCTVISGGNGIGTLQANFTENAGTSQRTAVITVSSSGLNSQAVTVVQEGATAMLNVSPQSQTVGAAAGTASYTVTSNGYWTAQSDADWCSVTPSGSGNGTLSVSYAENPDAEQRTTAITVSVAGAAVQTVTLVQEGSQIMLSVQPSVHQVGAGDGAVAFNVSANTFWTVQSDAEWCSVTPSGNGNGTILVEYDVNQLPDQRTALITVTAGGSMVETVAVVQAGVNSSMTVYPEYHQVTSDAGSAVFYISSNTSWAAQSSASWCVVTPSGTGDGEILAEYGANDEDDSRIAVITLSTTNGDLSQEVVLYQDGLKTGIAMPEAEPFRIYPNPTGSHIVISGLQDTGAKALWMLKDLSGRTVKSGDVLIANDTLLHLGDMPRGSYLLLLNTGKEVRSAAVMIN